MPARKYQLSRYTSKTKSVKARRMGETSYEHTQPESSIERSQSLTATAHGQRISIIRNQLDQLSIMIPTSIMQG
ncbi:Uncharacterized protein FWK35_00016075 [Aphis craccivora]|uniref:Uncharacterized protein n=1 Tax=Aphis craccivora TaxID=307492 RepID=A0A6G0ZB76_APHCR|nr:Uncharacterized protein FWK35_00016075 [Aphis craccivora]